MMQKKSRELITLARDIRTILNDERDNHQKIDTTLLSFLDELNQILKERDSDGGPEIAQIPWAGKTAKEIQEEEDKVLRAQEARRKRLEELERMKQYIQKMQEYIKKQEEQKEEHEMEEYHGMSM